MVIFGAGASYDSVAGPLTPEEQIQSIQNRPPLANQLFDRRFGSEIARFPRCQPVIPYLQQPGVNVEQVLEKLQSEANEYKERFRQLAAIRCYLQTMLSDCLVGWSGVTKGVTNYKTLLDQIEHRRSPKEKVCLVTFNYDTLLEDALPTVGVDIRSIAAYVSTDYQIIKLHGSINWAHEIKNFQPDTNRPRDNVANDLIDNAPDLQIDKSFQIASGAPISANGRTPLVPALSIPVENKPGYECPDGQLQSLEDCLPHVSKVLIIGWRAAENRFLQTLANKLRADASLMVVSSNQVSALQVIAKLRNWLPGNIMTAGKDGGFSGSIMSREADNFLKD